MLNLIKKEFMLCAHPTSYIFLSFAALVFVPNYPYEVIFFFSGLSAYFYCLSARENGDLAFSCALPVKKEYVPLARILTVSVFQCILMVLVLILSIIKQAVMPAEMLFNRAGISANFALVGNCAVIAGLFNVLFFPIHYKNPDKIGVPFMISAAAIFFLILIFIILRWTTPLFAEILNGSNSVNLPAKICVLFTGIAIYDGLTFLACRASVKNFLSADI